MMRSIAGEDRRQSTPVPGCLDDDVTAAEVEACAAQVEAGIARHRAAPDWAVREHSDVAEAGTPVAPE